MSGWRRAAYGTIRPLLFRSDPEAIHHRALGALRIAGGRAAGRALCRFAAGVASPSGDPALELMGLTFRNRVGLGAGFDKDGRALRGWAALGFGFVEVGTVTPRPQAANPRPRLFRIPEHDALINRMGFNNLGAESVARAIADARAHLPDGFVVGVNIGRNRDTPEPSATDDYVAAARAVVHACDYLTINVSSPNTPGVRDLQVPERLVPLIDAVAEVAPSRPILVKVSPDLDDERFDAIMAALVTSAVRGVVISNTTTRRDGIVGRHAAEAGGLSGAPLLDRVVARVSRARQVAGPGLSIVASGGIASRADAAATRAAGADLVQLWTGMIYAGPGLIGETVGA